uniref:Uncharacterized protein n=1 Tax=Ciona savignyi TaxID=51511 RepID=H2Z778_CIOSA
MAEVIFASAFTGYIKLRQIIYEDGSSSPTTMEVSIFNSGTNLGVTTTNHNWHVHIDPVMNETQCSDALGHYNPYGAPVNSANYAGTNKCTRNQPLACELGDLSNKHV